MREEDLSTQKIHQNTAIQEEGKNRGKRISYFLTLSSYTTQSVTPWHYDRPTNSQRDVIYLQDTGFIFSGFLSKVFCRATCDSSWGLSLEPCTSFVPHSSSWHWMEMDGTVETQPESCRGSRPASRSFLSGLYVQTAPTWQLRQRNKFRLVGRVLKRSTAKFSPRAIELSRLLCVKIKPNTETQRQQIRKKGLFPSKSTYGRITSLGILIHNRANFLN